MAGRQFQIATIKDMQTLENLERKFLSIIPTKPFELGDVRATTDSDKQLTVEQAKQDIAVLVQMLINTYGGWPFYPKLLRLRILNKLNRIYDKITRPITASELFAQLKPIIENGAYHRVDIANLIRQQKSKSIFHKLFNWQKD